MMLELKFDSKAVKEPIISIATLETHALINIIRASVGARHGEIVVEVDDSKAKDVVEVFERYGVDVSRLDKAIVKDEDRCIHCGACVSICPVETFSMDADKRVVVDTSKCIHCGICVKVCPVGALTLP